MSVLSPHSPPRHARWWQRPGVVIALLVVLPPVGIVLAWLSDWPRRKKTIAIVLSALWLALFVATPSKAEHEGKGKAAAPKPAGRASASPAPSPTPSETPSPTPPPTPTPTADPQMPDVVNMPYGKASDALKKLVDGGTEAYSAYTDVELVNDHDDWTVCFQSPSAGTPLAPAHAAPKIHVAPPGTPCPKSKNTELHPKPTTEPGPDPDRKPGTGGASGGSAGGGGVGVVHPGAFCSPQGATGVTTKGTPMTCAPSTGGRNRWRSA
ncbi:hypothetical protein BLA24_22125 [Streptomyces cinnamoneus]|uniref:PASTA domain-containing protein n=1 Tax=Streptomyces cinnamoneus TaxID=53446 RepID=A0A2G1XG93_STRCJ|nr:PASTA domain-containing protein [Streptomyces cinnamoneus]PHQ50254.1 hypothetical protein BLA24_22125 [Streptomyces cinnamoneus]PPT12960.1 hypothetical protein CYQ11_08660 [Streptomyces cinnamoneus]